MEPVLFRFYRSDRVSEIEASSVSEARRRYFNKWGKFPSNDTEVSIVKDEN